VLIEAPGRTRAEGQRAARSAGRDLHLHDVSLRGSAQPEGQRERREGEGANGLWGVQPAAVADGARQCGPQRRSACRSTSEAAAGLSAGQLLRRCPSEITAGREPCASAVSDRTSEAKAMGERAVACTIELRPRGSRGALASTPEGESNADQRDEVTEACRSMRD
jgi:hypothetical protein